MIFFKGRDNQPKTNFMQDTINDQSIQLSCEYVLDLSKSKEEQERTTIKKRLFLQYLDSSHGIITSVCQKVEIGRSTFYYWDKNDKDFHSSVLSIIHSRGEVLEDRLYAKALEGDTQALKFLLPHMNSKYKKKAEQERKVHIYHHVGIQPNMPPDISLEDIVGNPELLKVFLDWKHGKKEDK